MYQPILPGTWKGRIDAQDGIDGQRWHQIIQYINLTNQSIPSLSTNQKGIAFVGFCSDEGVKRNQGRVGAAEGPNVLRNFLGSFPINGDHHTLLIEAGNVVCENGNLEGAQQEIGSSVYKLLSNSFFPILFGGGHEIAYGHFLGINQYLKNQIKKDDLGIINFDAHFDLRKSDQTTSGTPFLQIAESLPHDYFSYLCLGIQQAGNTRALFKKAEELKVNYVVAEDLHLGNKNELINKLDLFIASKKHIYLTICLDVFAAAFAPGVSAPAANGVLPDIVFQLIRHIIRTGKVMSCDVAELNPVHDIDNHTARLAAALIYAITQEHTSSNKNL
jgi:formiminoglutamase